MSFSSHLTIDMATAEAERIIKRLTNHWRHKLTIENRENGELIHFSKTNQCLLSAKDEQLHAHLITDSEESLNKLQDVVLSHLNRMAQQEFNIDWTNI